MSKPRESAGSKGKAGDQECEKGRVGTDSRKPVGEEEIRKHQNRRAGQRAAWVGRGQRGDLDLVCRYKGSLVRVSSNRDSAGSTRLGAGLGFPDQTLLVQRPRGP